MLLLTAIALEPTHDARQECALKLKVLLDRLLQMFFVARPRLSLVPLGGF